MVLLIALTGVEPGQVIMARARNTALGGALALLAYWLWPTWERSQVGDIFARMLDAYREHFELGHPRFLRRDAGVDRGAGPHPAPPAGWRARNLEASVDRLTAEPATTAAERDPLARDARQLPYLRAFD